MITVTWIPDSNPESDNSSIPQVDKPPGAGGLPLEAETPPGCPDHYSTAADHIADARARLIAAADNPDLPPGTLPNVLGALARLAVTQADLEAHPPAVDPAARARAEARTDQLTELLELYLVRLLELHSDIAQIFGEMADALAGYTHHCEGARPLWRALRLARRTWNEAHGRDPATSYIPDPTLSES